MVTEVWSGGQDGADIAGLRAAKIVGLPTGGWMPNGWRTMSGRRPGYAAMYGMTEHESWRYQPRTACNVRDCDPTLLLGDDPESSGCAFTQKCAVSYKKPLLIVTTAEMAEPGSIERVRAWLEANDCRRVNIAGNRSAPEDVLEAWLVRLFKAEL
jgi:hypothetical protein